MKKNILIKGVAAVMLIGAFASCSSDYLDTTPQTSIDTSTVQSSAEGAQLAANGVFLSMYCQYSGWNGYFCMNGEPWVDMFYGEILSADYFSYYWSQYGTNLTNWEGLTNPNYWFCQPGWQYNYTLISECNNVLVGIDTATGDASTLQYIKAELLTVRAHAYVKLLQLYGPRWEDSNNGAVESVVLRLGTDNGDSPLVSMNKVLDQIYSDLDTAIELFDNLNIARSGIWEPNAAVARGVYARAALLKHDYVTAQKMAHDARQGYPIMSADEYKEGFAVANGEWMWSHMLSNFIYYWSHGSFYACNGAYPLLWGNTQAGNINYDLYRQIPEDDIRRDLYWTPDKRLRNVNPDDFWNENYVDPSTMNVMHNNFYMAQSLTAYAKKIKPSVATYNAYTPRTDSGEDDAASEVAAGFGAQFKFWGVDGYGTNQFPFMRASEMLLAEAEAAYYNNDLTTARNCLVELNTKRGQTSYTCDKSGQQLLDEIRLYRRIELWGEGKNWMDYKRWNIPMERRVWVAGDNTSNNVPANCGMTKNPSDMNGWRIGIPLSESNYNADIDRNGSNTGMSEDKSGN
jgi:hypothetical protein